MFGVTWASDDTLVIAERGLRAIPKTGGTGRWILEPDSVARPGETLRWPRMVSDGKTVLFVRWSPEGLAGAHIGVTSLVTGESEVLDLPGTWPLGVAEGHLFYVSRTGTVMGVPFDLRSRALTGAPRALLQGVDLNPGVGVARAALSASGTLVYLTGADWGAGGAWWSRLAFLESDGSTRALFTDANLAAPAWSPDGGRIAVQVTSAQGKRDVGILDVATGALQLLPN